MKNIENLQAMAITNSTQENGFSQHFLFKTRDSVLDKILAYGII
jgi:hypothetical protein